MPTPEQAKKELRRRAAVAELQRRESLSQQPTQQTGLGQRIGEDLRTRGANVRESLQALSAGEVSPLEAGLRTIVQPTVGAGLDVVGEVSRAGFEALPQQVQQPLRAAGQFVGEEVVAPAVSAVGRLPSAGGGTIGEAIPRELAEHPRIANVLEDLGLVASVVSPAKGFGAVRKISDVTGRSLGEVGEKLIKKGGEQAQKVKSDFASNLVAPIETTKFLEGAVAAGRVSEEGLKRSRVVAPTPREASAAGVLSDLDINPNRSFVHNNNVVLGGIDTKAKQLAKELDELKVFFPKQEVKARLAAKADGVIDETAFLVGNAELTLGKVKDLMGNIIDQNLSTPSGLLRARKQIDAELRAQTLTKSGSTIFDSPAEKAITNGIRDLRQEINNIIAEKAPSVNVKQSLGEQSLLFEARDTISAKAAREGADAVERLSEKISKKQRTDVRFLGKGLAASEVAAGSAVKGLRSAGAKKALGEVLRGADKAIKLEKDIGIVKQLRADRAIVLELLKEEETENAIQR